MPVAIKRAYESPSPGDGRRYLIDRLWPRGVTKDALRLSEWLKELAPSPELRTWFGHDPAKFPAFRTRYRSELATHPALVERLTEEAKAGKVTLVFAAHDAAHCNAAVLQELLESRVSLGRSRRAKADSPPRARRSG